MIHTHSPQKLPYSKSAVGMAILAKSEYLKVVSYKTRKNNTGKWYHRSTLKATTLG